MAIKVSRPSKNQSTPLTADARSEFENFLLSNGMTIDPKKGLVSDGSVGRAFMEVEGKRKLTGWYQLWLDQSVPYGRCGDYRLDHVNPTAQWRPNNGARYEMTEDQKAEIRRLQEEAKIEQLNKQTKAAKIAQNIWEKSTPCEKHPYLERKQVFSHGLRQHEDGRLIIPLLDAQLEIVGLEYIDDDGGKKFLTGSKKKGSFFILGQHMLQDAKVINYAEGYATAASYFQDMAQPVVVCFDAGNLKPVGETISDYFPNAKHVFIADQDESKTGEIKAVEASQAVRSRGAESEVLIPEEIGDYNDHAVEGELIPKLKPVTVPTEYEFNRNERGRYLNTKDNVQGVMTLNGIKCAYNVIKKRMEILVPDSKFIQDMQDESALIEIEDRCIQMNIPHTKVRDYLKLLAVEYNPVKDWMESRQWDGQGRLQAFLDSITSADKSLKEMLMKKWLISCVAAACEPNGVSLEGILVFQGAQGLGKTLWFKRLADYDEGWLLEGATLNPSDKDSVKQAVSHWLVELGELQSTFKRSDMDQLKAFVTKRVDELRLPYDRAFTTYQRRTAFYASVNEREFLIDTTGNRRFWVIPVTGIDVNHGVDMQQLWAEVKETMYREGQQNWFLSPDERAQLQESNELYRTQSSVEDLILEHVNFDSVDTKPVQMTKLLRDLGVSNPRMADFKDAARILSERGKEPRRSSGKKIYDLCYSAIEDDKSDSFGFSPKGWD
jgi:putative DNA primase/helicase